MATEERDFLVRGKSKRVSMGLMNEVKNLIFGDEKVVVLMSDPCMEPS